MRENHRSADLQPTVTLVLKLLVNTSTKNQEFQGHLPLRSSRRSTLIADQSSFMPIPNSRPFCIFSSFSTATSTDLYPAPKSIFQLCRRRSWSCWLLCLQKCRKWESSWISNNFQLHSKGYTVYQYNNVDIQREWEKHNNKSIQKQGNKQPRIIAIAFPSI